MNMGNRKAHVVVIPYPAQGHAAPMMKLSHNLVNHGIKVTFVNIHSQYTAPIFSHDFYQDIPLLTLVSIHQGSESHLQDLIQNINEDSQITHAIADVSLDWALNAANQMGIIPVGFVPYGVANFSFVLHVPQFLHDGIIDVHGTPTKEEIISLSNDIPPWSPKSLVWSFPDKESQKLIFKNLINHVAENVKCCKTILANSFNQLETEALNLIPNILPIGPLLPEDHLAITMFGGDSTCLDWLDKQPPGSVIYAAFGSSMFSTQQQLNELAIGLELTKRPFLWALRSDFTKGTEAKLAEGFIERVGKYGKIVKWAPQEKVLGHPSIACFFSHCGWNSTMEGLSKGVPFLCWPYAVDQFHNRDNICDTWKIGVQVVPDENGIVTGHEIQSKVEKLISDEVIKANSWKFMEIAGKSIKEGGSSFINFKSFVSQLQQQED